MEPRQEAATAVADPAAFPASADRWNSNEEIRALLAAAVRRGWDWIRGDTAERPPSGSLLLYDRASNPNYKLDGYLWKTRKEGNQPREDHLRLKVKGHGDCLVAHYVHSALVPSFHRRAYSLRSAPNVVLVHYLNAPGLLSEGDGLRPALRRRLRPHAQLSRALLLSQLRPILCSPLVVSADLPLADELVVAVVDEVKAAYAASLAPTRLPLPPKMAPLATQAPGPILLLLQNAPIARPQPSMEPAPLAESSMEDSGFFSAPSPIPHSRPSPLCRGESSGSILLSPSSNSQQDQEQMSHSMPYNNQQSFDSEVSSTSSVSEDFFLFSGVGRERPNQLSSDNQRAGCGFITKIVAVSPNWIYEEEESEVVVIGPWYAQCGNYSVRFGQKMAPAVLIQSGVLRVSPPCQPEGTVQMRVVFDGESISDSAEFHYRAKQPVVNSWSGSLSALLGRLGELGSHVGEGSGGLESALEAALCQEVERLSRVGECASSASSSVPRATLLHLCASLGFSSLIAALQTWRAERPSPWLEQELCPWARDGQGRSPLHVAAAAGQLNVAKLLSEAWPQGLASPDAQGRTPVQVGWARVFRFTGDGGLQAALFAGQSATAQSLWESSRGDGGADPTALWVFTSGASSQPRPSRPESPQSLPFLVLGMWLTSDAAGLSAGEERAEPSPVERERMATLAEKIINALPDRIKQSDAGFPAVLWRLSNTARV